MYKTIRHGENSLQYTILPQNDDSRIEGKLTSASSNKAKSKRSVRRRFFFAYLGLLFVCTVIIGAILVPFLVSAECLPNPSDWFLKTKAAFTGSSKRLAETSLPVKKTKTLSSNNTSTTTDAKNNNNQIESTIKAYPVESSSTAIPQISNPQIDIEESRGATASGSTETSSNVEATQISESRIGNDFIAEVRFEGLRGQMASKLAPTIVVTTVRNNDQNKVPVTEGRIPPTLTTLMLSTIRTTSISAFGVSNKTHRVMQVPLLKSAAKKPIIPPVLAKTNSLGRESVKSSIEGHQIKHQENVKKDPTEPNDWIRSHWPYIDPSTYFQWTGYKTEDSVILPAILGAALIVVIMIVALFFVARNKRTIVSSVRKRNRNDIEEAGEDNTTLLTNSNLSDDD
ncbi:uncharacterized protein LOC129908670 [Episyrphus balteatus]|uniref:uncharacterized protein LOC129908670 n=1 Tax=Episyrphus balteatus TaxID=286459 RepID=UPI002484E978|nr:uncharacterized protein LOC129908670 [Episyrphus balteatus]